MVAQTYDGAAVMVRHLNGVQAKVIDEIPHAISVHGYAHKLNLVLSQAVSYISDWRVFFFFFFFFLFETLIYREVFFFFF